MEEEDVDSVVEDINSGHKSDRGLLTFNRALCQGQNEEEKKDLESGPGPQFQVYYARFVKEIRSHKTM